MKKYWSRRLIRKWFPKYATVICQECQGRLPEEDAVMRYFGMGSELGFQVTDIWCPNCAPERVRGSVIGIAAVKDPREDGEKDE